MHVKHDLTGHDPSGSGSKCIDVYTSPSAVVGVEQEWGLKKKKSAALFFYYSLFLRGFVRHKMCESTMESAHFVVHVSVWESNVNL